MMETKNLWNVILWGLGFLMVFTAFGPCHNTVSEAFDQAEYDSLGQFTIGILYLSFAIWSLFWAPLIENLGAVNSMWLGSFWYLIWIFSGLLPIAIEKTPVIEVLVWIVMTLTGAINGFGASLLWVGQGKYVSDCWNESNKGFYYGLSWFLFTTSSFTGNTIEFLIK